MVPAFTKPPYGLAVACLATLLVSCPESDEDPPAEPLDILVFSQTEAFRHLSIPSAVAAMEAMAAGNGWELQATESTELFREGGLTEFDVVVFLLTTGDVLSDDQQRAFEDYIRSGGAYVGVHSASDTEYQWGWYGDLVGAYFQDHLPLPVERTITVADRSHPASAHLDERWTRTDEWYAFRTNPRANTHVLMTLQGGTMGDHPLAWCHEYQGARSFYTALGHTEASWSEDAFLEHVKQGVLWAGSRVEGDCATGRGDVFEKQILETDVTSPMKLEVASDGRVWWVERFGALRVHDPPTGITTLVGELPVETGREDGLLGLLLDPDFEATGRIYLYYSPPEVDANRLSSFEVLSDRLDMESEQLILEIPNQRDSCCHTGGGLAWDTSGLLYLSTGDNSNPSRIKHAPIDGRPGEEVHDARRSAGNTQDLRGKILRIRIEDEGYSIPEGNLFSDPEEGAPEIYVMGTRNPFTLSIDPLTDTLYWGEVGPDAFDDEEELGPRGYDEFNRTSVAANMGWPFCIADNKPYQDYDYATETSSGAFDCSGPLNESPNNTGASLLPSATPAWLWYPYGAAIDHPELGTSLGRMAVVGPRYRATGAYGDLPAYYDGVLFIADWMNEWVKVVHFDEAGEVLDIHEFASEVDLLKPMAMDVGPDGRLYFIEFGTLWGPNDDAQIVRLEYRGPPR
jgi:glucose/arabinose dehydrogenase